MDMETEKELEQTIEKNDEEPKEKSEFVLSFLSVGKWQKSQKLSLVDLTNLDGLISALKGIALIILLVQYIRLRKKK